jgi:hypothetical protein
MYQTRVEHANHYTLTLVFAKGKQFMFLIRHRPCNSHKQVVPDLTTLKKQTTGGKDEPNIKAFLRKEII